MIVKQCQIGNVEMKKLTCSDIPLVERTVLRTRNKFEVVQGPGHTGDLALMPLQHVQGFERDGIVDVDRILHNFKC